MLRYLLGSVDESVGKVISHTSLIQGNLAPLDTLHALITVQNGRTGTFSMSVGIEFKTRIIQVEIVTEKALLTLSPVSISIKSKDGQDQMKESQETFPMTWGVKEEVAAFGKSIESNELDPRLCPEEALKDLKLLEAMFESGECGGGLVKVEVEDK
jgi:predicted dehydrogenase